MRRGPVPTADALDIVSQLASALAVIHAHGIVHRDVKPENSMLVADGRGGVLAKILDFGIARVPWEEAPSTREGKTFWTTGYASPEQIFSAEPVTTAADVYALGVVCFELLRGEPPFSGSPQAIARAHFIDAPPLDAIANVPHHVVHLVGAMLSKQASERPTAAFVRDALARDSLSRVRPASTPPPIVSAETKESGTRESVPLIASGRSLERRRARLAWIGTAIGVSCAAVVLFASLRARHTRKPEVALSAMVRLPGGTFTMGRSPQELDAECAHLGSECIRTTLDREQPKHTVSVSPFYLDVYETTNREFAAWLQALQASIIIRNDADTKQPRFVDLKAGDILLADTHPTFGGLEIRAGTVAARAGYEDRPVVQITWDAARLYCAWRGKRLPTEAEHELAARGLGDRRYPWGNEEPRCDGVIFDRDDGQRCVGLPQGVQPVVAGDQDWSPERVHGLAGNAAEWVQDGFSLPFYADCGDCVDPVTTVPTDPQSEAHVFRGSAWANNAMFVRSTGRARWPRQSLSTSLGVRCALSAK
jgi:formylglycine-generating enzyme required for sulfatase activity